jgi:hypothetical protein
LRFWGAAWEFKDFEKVRPGARSLWARQVFLTEKTWRVNNGGGVWEQEQA